MGKSENDKIYLNITGITEENHKVIGKDGDAEFCENRFEMILEGIDIIYDAVKELDDSIIKIGGDTDIPDDEWFKPIFLSLRLSKNEQENIARGILKELIFEELDIMRDFLQEAEDEEEERFDFSVRFKDKSFEDSFDRNNLRNLVKAALLRGYINWNLMMEESLLD